MKQLLLIFISSILFSFNCLASNAQIIITEIMYNPPEAGMDTLEFLELYNHSDNAVDMTNWIFTEGITFTFPEFVLEAGEYITLCVREQAFKAVYGDDIPVFQWTARALVNGGELIELSDDVGEVVYSVDYKSGANGWYTEADGNGASIELCNLNANPNVKESWRPSEHGLGIIINDKELFCTPDFENSTECELSPDYTIEVGHFFFDPNQLTIPVGSVVRWMNSDGTHNVNGTTTTFPNNPVSFTSGTPASNWTFDFTFDTPGTYQYRCDLHPGAMQGTIIVEDDGEPELPLYEIADVRSVDAEGVADSAGVECALIGIVHGVNIRPTGQGLQFTLIDENNDGIGVFSSSATFGYTVNEGDRVRIEGTIEQFRGLLQVVLSDLELIEPGNTSPVMPMVVTQLNEDSENRLITLNNVTIVDPTEWTNAPGGFNVTVTDGLNNHEMRIARNVETFTEAPSGTFHLTGIGGQFSATTPPWLDGYQILPRYAADFNFVTSTKENEQQLNISIFPNPVKSEFTIQSDVEFEETIVLTMTGREVFRQEGRFQQLVVPATAFVPGVYILQLVTNQTIATRKFIVE